MSYISETAANCAGILERALADEAGISYRRHQITGRRDPLGRQGVAL